MRVVAVTGIKGGVGKSLVASNLAYALKARGLRVGILDADVDSPYLVEIAGIQGKVGLDEHRRMVPVVHDGMPVMSFALWVPGQFQGATMHGSMHERWIEDAFRHTAWGDLDVLVSDLPAGSSDEYLAVKRLAGDQLLGLVAVALPNVVSGLRRVFDTATYHALPILGVVENESGEVLGTGKVEAFCRENKLRYYGSIPMDKRIREGNEQGEPLLPADLAGPVEQAAQHITGMLAEKVVA